jgi:hypothetical protein
MSFRTLLAACVCTLASSFCQGQILSVDPPFPNQNDLVTIIYDATKGNAALTGVTPVYAHTGVITNLSTSNTDWRHVQGVWGTADNNVLMTSLGNNRHQIQYNISSFYNPGAETVSRMAFVFRNVTGSVVGRETDGSDIFYNVYPPGNLYTAFFTPSNDYITVSQGSPIPTTGAASDTSTFTITDNGAQVYTSYARSFSTTVIAGAPGTHEVILVANNGISTARDTFHYVVAPQVTVAALPANTLPGINYLGGGNVRLRLDAPGKLQAYVIGSFNGFHPDTAFFMRRTPDNNTFWLDLNLTSGQFYTFQYLVDGSIKVADPYSTTVLDPNNDQWITPATYPNMPSYPTGQTSGVVSLIQPGATPYAWQTTSFQKPAETDLVVYELLVRDFVAAHDYQTIKDTLDYLERLGVNAIEFMPVNEFEGNESWGYNPSFHMALDKYYGPANTLKALIDECHARGIAVILDVAFNHAFSQSPFCQLFWDAANFKPAPNNPWLNADARHPFNVGYDFNHESPWTQLAFTTMMEYWMEEFKIDGFRFDLSKGFTQTNSGSNVGLWGQFDQSRIDIWNTYKNAMRAVTPDVYLILEHFAENSEETALHNMSFMLWGNSNNAYNEATMGYIGNSNFEWIDYKVRGWNSPKVMGFMESHDEQRLMYKNLSFGNSNGGYDIKNLATALKRMELAGNFFFTIPGPKMVWQFGERGYDVDIEDPCRVCNKPPRWNYMLNYDRVYLYKVWSALANLRADNPAFETTNYNHTLGGTVKKIFLNGSNMDVAVFGNFGVGNEGFQAGFQHTGMWYEYWTGDSINVTDVNMSFTFNAGEYRLYTDERLPAPDLNVIIGLEDNFALGKFDLLTWPNPTAGAMNIRYSIPQSSETELALYDLTGRKVLSLLQGFQAAGEHEMEINTGGLPAGNYLLRVRTEEGVKSRPVVLLGE